MGIIPAVIGAVASVASGAMGMMKGSSSGPTVTAPPQKPSAYNVGGGTSTSATGGSGGVGTEPTMGGGTQQTMAVPPGYPGVGGGAGAGVPATPQREAVPASRVPTIRNSQINVP